MKRIPLLLSALLAVLVLALAACGGDDESGTTGSGGESTPSGETPGKAIQSDPANKSKTLTIGSKNFTEQYILGEIYAQALEAAGFTVKKELDLGSEQIAFKALKRGDIDAYPEYTGTALTSFYKVKTDDVPRDKDESFTQLQDDLKADDITAFPQTPFENTYKIAGTKEIADKLGNPKTLSELVEAGGNKYRLSAFPECRQRTDCLVGLKDKYGFNPKFVSSQGQYADLDAGEAEFTTGFSTDGQLATGKYVIFEDDKGLYPPYYVTLLTRNDAVQKLGQEGQQVIEEVQKPLTNEVMQELNSRVAIDKEKPEDVAAQYLKEAGFVQ